MPPVRGGRGLGDVGETLTLENEAQQVDDGLLVVDDQDV